MWLRAWITIQMYKGTKGVEAMGKKILIVGANIEDKGSQAKLYIVVDKLRQKWEDCEIFYAHNGEQYDDSLCRFNKILYNKKVQAQVLKSNPLASITKMFSKKNDSSANDPAALIPQMDLILDLSEYVLHNATSIPDIQSYLDNIRIAKKFKIPIIMMPQSYGPLNFSFETMSILGEMKDILFYPKAIYTREQYGYDELMGYFGLDNLRVSTDMMLPNDDFILSNVLTKYYKPEMPVLPESDNVAIIPDARYFTKKNADRANDLYVKVFDVLKNANKNIYIISYTPQDTEVCKNLCSMFRYYGKVTFMEQELDSVELNLLMRNFEVVVSSYYLACVQAYRNFVPAVLLGSGAPFIELAELFAQEKLNFDILDENCNYYDVADALDALLKDVDVAKTRIQTRMLNIQSKSCFEVFDELKW